MKKWGMAVLVVLFLSVAGGKTSVVYGNSFSETDGQDVEEEQITESMLQRIGASKVQDFLDKQENLSDVSFSSLVIGILKGEEGISPEKVGTWLKETLFYELAETKGLFVQVLVISIAFGILKNFRALFCVSVQCTCGFADAVVSCYERSDQRDDRYHGGIYADPDPGVWHVNGVFQWYGNGGGFL